MTNAVFYSVCPFGTGTIETGDGTIEITSGVATLSVAQTGNIGAGVCVEYNSLVCWIAPNRIAFTSGGTTELLVDTKIAGGTSGATGIVRAIEVNSGTWAGGDAAGWIYFESTTGTWNSSEQINRTKPTSSTNIATTNGSLEGNIGNGNTEFVVKNATGGAASNQTSTSVTSVHHEWASLADFETYFIDSSHIGSSSLVTADVVAYACCYYDHANPTTNPDDDAVDIDFGTTGADNYLQIYTPIGGAESINSQRHDGKWNTSKYRFEVSTDENIEIYENYVRLVGIQVLNNSPSIAFHAIYFKAIGSSGVGKVDKCIIKSDQAIGIKIADSDWNVEITNSVIYDCDEPGVLITTATSVDIFNCIIATGSASYGISQVVGTVTVTNCAVFNNSTDFDGTITATYTASDDTKAGTGNIDWDNGATDWANNFEDYANGDFHLKSTAPDLIDAGTPQTSAGLWRGIDGNERGASWDIGADEYVSAGPSISIPVIMHHLRQQGIS